MRCPICDSSDDATESLTSPKPVAREWDTYHGQIVAAGYAGDVDPVPEHNALVARLREVEEHDRSFRCSYCGYSISGCADKEEVETIMRAHMEECDKHPMARLRAQLAAAVEHVDALAYALRELLRIREWSIEAGGCEGPLPRDIIVKFAEMQLPAVEAAYIALRSLDAALAAKEA